MTVSKDEVMDSLEIILSPDELAQVSAWADDAEKYRAARPENIGIEVVDAPRSIILYADTAGRTIQGLRQHLDYSGFDYSFFPKWAKIERGHLTKAGIAILVYLTMHRAAIASQSAEVKNG